MASANHVLLSPAELAYLHSSLSQTPPIRPDGRHPTQFRPLTAETAILPGTNGSARVCFADGTEAIVGVKMEIEKTVLPHGGESSDPFAETDDSEGSKGRNEWLELVIEIPGSRDDDSGTIFLASMLSESLLADKEFAKRLAINRRFHWKLYIDILLISPPLSYPLPLLSLTTHLALLATRFPRLKSEGDEDPMFDDDWEASIYLYPRSHSSRPPITLLVVSIGGNVLFDPSKEELAVAEVVLAVSVAEFKKPAGSSDEVIESGRELRLLSVRTVDPPSRLTPPGIPNAENPAAAGATAPAKKTQTRVDSGGSVDGVWKAPLGGAKLAVLDRMIGIVLEKGGVADEVLDGLDMVDLL